MASDRNSFGAGHVIVSGGSNNMSADVYSPMVAIGGAYGFSAQTVVVEGGSLGTGVLYFQVSNDGSNWVNLALSGGGTSIAVAAASRNDMSDFLGVNARFLRVFYDFTSGNAKLDAYVCINRLRG